MKRLLLATVTAIALPFAALAQSSPPMTTGTAGGSIGAASGGTATEASPSGVAPPVAGTGTMSGPSASPAPMAAAAPTATPALSVQDTHFINTAAIAGMAEVSDGKLATVKGDARVKTLGNRMVTDHTKVNDQLMALAKQEGATLPMAVDAKHAAIHAQLTSLSGAGFDHKYLSTELTGHQMTISAFKAEASTGSNTQLKSFASATLPQLEDHLAMVQADMK